MGLRPARLLPLACTLFVAGCGAGDTDERPQPRPGQRPSTRAQQAAAEVAVRFARRVQAGDARGACAMLVGRPRRSFRCDTRPVIRGGFRIARSERLDDLEVATADAPGAERIGILLERGAPYAVEVDERGRVRGVGSYAYG